MADISNSSTDVTVVDESNGNKSVINTHGDIHVASFDQLLAMQVDEASASVTYQGWATIGSSTASAVWRIRKISKSGNVTSITWADSDSSFNNIWDNRASLTYG